MMGENESRCSLIRCRVSSFAEGELALLFVLFITIDYGYCSMFSFSLIRIFLCSSLFFRWLMFFEQSVILTKTRQPAAENSYVGLYTIICKSMVIESP